MGPAMRLHDFLEFHARIRPHADFAVMGSRTVSYGEADAAANRLANAMAAAGLEVGDRVAVLSKNCIEYLLVYFACAKAGVVPVPLNYRLAPPEWAFILGDAGARMVIARKELVHAFAPVKAEDTSEHVMHAEWCELPETTADAITAAATGALRRPPRTVTHDRCPDPRPPPSTWGRCPDEPWDDERRRAGQ